MRADGRRLFMQRALARVIRIASLTGICFTANAFVETPAPERIEWRKVPIEVPLTVNIERQIQFPVPVKIGLPASLATHLRVQSISDTIYLQAAGTFAPTRIVVQSRDGALTYLLDLRALATDAPTAPIQIVDPAVKTTPATVVDAVDCAPRPTIDPVALTRYAAQQLYAPARFVHGISGVVRVPVSTKPIDLVRGVALSAVPIIAWRSGLLHVTAIKLTNTGPTPVELDPRALRGEWLTATFQHNRLLAAGHEADLTVVYLVSSRPFAVAR